MRKGFLGLLAVAVVAAALFLPLPLYIVAPGSALSVPERIEFTAPEDEVTGDFLLTTVRVGEARPLGALLAWIDDERDVVERERVVPEGVDTEEYFRAQRRVFVESSRIAAAVGLRAAGEEVTITGNGAEVVAVVPGAPSEGRLREGDVIIGVNGTPLEVAADLVAAVSQLDAGETMRLEVRRDGSTQTVEVQLRRIEGFDRPALGIAVDTVDPRIELPFDVEVDQGRIGGPSAGLMIALSVYDLAAAADVARGRIIAGTGTIDVRGQVGPVGGVDQKVAAAITAGADVFLAPPQEASAARRAAGDGLDVIEVATLDEAIERLEE